MDGVRVLLMKVNMSIQRSRKLRAMKDKYFIITCNKLQIRRLFVKICVTIIKPPYFFLSGWGEPDTESFTTLRGQQQECCVGVILFKSNRHQIITILWDTAQNQMQSTMIYMIGVTIPCKTYCYCCLHVFILCPWCHNKMLVSLGN